MYRLIEKQVHPKTTTMLLNGRSIRAHLTSLHSYNGETIRIYRHQSAFGLDTNSVHNMIFNQWENVVSGSSEGELDSISWRGPKNS